MLWHSQELKLETPGSEVLLPGDLCAPSHFKEASRGGCTGFELRRLVARARKPFRGRRLSGKGGGGGELKPCRFVAEVFFDFGCVVERKRQGTRRLGGFCVVLTCGCAEWQLAVACGVGGCTHGLSLLGHVGFPDVNTSVGGGHRGGGGFSPPRRRYSSPPRRRYSSPPRTGLAWDFQQNSRG